MATLSLHNLKKSYADTQVVHGIDIAIDTGEFIVIVGPSGCGKSSLLRMIAGLETVSAGEIKINGRTVNRLEPKKRNIAMVFQNYALYPHMTVYDNMAYALKLKGLSKAAIKTAVTKTAEILELGEVLQRKPQALSGGQRQRVAMGRAIIREPDIFLFDEPLSNLDAKLRVQMRLEIKKLQRKLNITSVYVTHDQIEAMTLADRLVILNEGCVEQIGTPMQIYQHPASMFVAGFLGSPAMNFIPASLDATGRQIIIEDMVTFDHDLDHLKPYAGRSIMLGVRPEAIQIDGNDAFSMPFEVETTESLGADTLIYGHLLGMPELITCRATGNQADLAGQRVSISVALDDLHYFDPSSGKTVVEST